MTSSHEIRFLTSPLLLSSEFGRRFALRDLIHEQRSKTANRPIAPRVVAVDR